MIAFRRVLSEATILVAFVVLATFLALTTPGFASTTNGLSILLATSLIAVVAVGETFVVVTGGIDLSIGSNVALTGIVTGLALHAGLPVAPAVLLAMGFGGLIGLFNGVAVAYFGMNSFIVTLAMLAMARGLASLRAATRFSVFRNRLTTSAEVTSDRSPSPRSFHLESLRSARLFCHARFSAAIFTPSAEIAKPLAAQVFRCPKHCLPRKLSRACWQASAALS